MQKIVTLISLIVFVFSYLSLAQATDLDSARADKSITELPSGYIKANKDSVKAFADEVNAKRKQTYEEIAKKNGIPVEQVASQAAKKIEEKMKGGK